MTDVAPDLQLDRRPAHYRLSKDVWAIILEEYKAGATAPFLSLKWRVSQHALRARITKQGATKRDWGDEQAMTQARARAAALEAEAMRSPEARAARLFEPDLDEAPDAGDPAVLMRLATLASGRAMRGRLWAEARALASLAESYRRLAAAAEAAAVPAEPPMTDEGEGALRDALLLRMQALEEEFLAEDD